MVQPGCSLPKNTVAYLRGAECWCQCSVFGPRSENEAAVWTVVDTTWVHLGQARGKLQSEKKVSRQAGDDYPVSCGILVAFLERDQSHEKRESFSTCEDNNLTTKYRILHWRRRSEKCFAVLL